MREEAVGVARRADIEPFDGIDARLAEHTFRGGPQVEVASLQDVRTKPCAVRGGDFLADFVAARADRRSDDRCNPAAERGNARLHDPLEQTKPPCMEEREPCGAV